MSDLIYLDLKDIEPNKWYTPNYIPELGDYSSLTVIAWTNYTETPENVEQAYWHCAKGAGWRVIGGEDDEVVLYWMWPSYPDNV